MTKKHKKGKRLIILLLLVCVLIGALFGIKLLSQEETDDSEEETSSDGISFCSLESDDIYKLSIKNDSLEGSFTLKSDTWVYDADNTFPLNSETITGMLSTLESATATQSFTMEDGDETLYGFDEPMTVISCYNQGGVETKLTIGRHNITSDEYYLRVNEENTVYTIGSSVPSAFACDLMDLGEVETIPTLSVYNIKEMYLKSTERTIHIVSTGEYGDDMVGNTTWYIKEPFQETRGLVEDTFDDFVEDITGLTFTKLADYNVASEDYAKYGLGTNCERKLQFYYTGTDSTASEEETTTTSDGDTTTKKTTKLLTIYVGNMDETETYYYARFDISEGIISTDSHRVYLVDASTIATAVNMNPLQYMYKHVSYARLDDLKSFSVTVDGKTYDFELREVESEDGEESTESETAYEGALVYATRTLEFYLDGRKLDEKKFKTFYQKMIGIYADEILYDQSKVKDTEATISMHFEKLDEDDAFAVIDTSFSPYNSGKYQVTTNGTTEFLVSKNDVSDVLELFYDLIEE
jgi:hypothetical protein